MGDNRGVDRSAWIMMGELRGESWVIIEELTSQLG